MTHTTEITVRITLRPGDEPIQGEMTVNGCAPGRFHGWLELNDRIERALCPVAPAERESVAVGSRFDGEWSA